MKKQFLVFGVASSDSEEITWTDVLLKENDSFSFQFEKASIIGPPDGLWHGLGRGFTDPAFLPEADLPTPLTVSAIASTSVVAPQSGFSGPIFDPAHGNGWYPPDNALAVGTNAVVSAVNNMVQISDLNGSSVQSESLFTFFATATAADRSFFLTDPRAFLDPTTHRFTISIDEVLTNSSGAAIGSNLLVARSNDDLAPQPAGGTGDFSPWSFSKISTTYSELGGFIKTWADQPNIISLGANYFLESSNQFTTSGTYYNTKLVVGQYGSSTPLAVKTVSTPSEALAAIDSSHAYAVSYTHDSKHDLSIIKVTAGPTPSFSSATLISLGSLDTGSGGYTASQYGTTTKLDVGDGRITGAAFDAAHNKLYVTFEGKHGTDGTVGSLWAQIDMGTKQVTASGSLNDTLGLPASAGATTFNSSVAVDSSTGNVVFNFNTSRPNALSSDVNKFVTGDYAIWHYGSAASTMHDHVYQTSQDSYIDPANSTTSRWGDYSSVVAGAGTFWASIEYENGSVTGSSGTVYHSWGTAIYHDFLV
jgi:hypothetical protein